MRNFPHNRTLQKSSEATTPIYVEYPNVKRAKLWSEYGDNYSERHAEETLNINDASFDIHMEPFNNDNR